MIPLYLRITRASYPGIINGGKSDSVVCTIVQMEFERHTSVYLIDFGYSCIGSVIIWTSSHGLSTWPLQSVPEKAN